MCSHRYPFALIHFGFFVGVWLGAAAAVRSPPWLDDARVLHSRLTSTLFLDSGVRATRISRACTSLTVHEIASVYIAFTINTNYSFRFFAIQVTCENATFSNNIKDRTQKTQMSVCVCVSCL